MFASVRHRVAPPRLFAERHLRAARSHRAHGAGTSRILAYHSVGFPRNSVNDLNPQRFEQQVRAAIGLGYRFVPAAELARNSDLPGRLAITFDDGIRGLAEHVAPLLEELQIPFTVFVVTNWAEGHATWMQDAYMRWDELAALQSRGALLASHSHTHPNFSTLSEAQAAEELARSYELFEKRLGLHPEEFAIPYGQSRDWSAAAQRAAAGSPYSLIYAQAESTRPAGTIARTFVTRYDTEKVFCAALSGAFANWEEKY